VKRSRDDGKRQSKAEDDLADDERPGWFQPSAMTTSDGPSSPSAATVECRRKKPAMITWPAIVPTVAEERPDARSETAKIQLAALPSRVRASAARSRWWPRSCAGSQERGGGHHEHRSVHDAGHAHGDRDVQQLKPIETPELRGSRVTMRPWSARNGERYVRLTVAPRMPAASRTLSFL